MVIMRYIAPQVPPRDFPDPGSSLVSFSPNKHTPSAPVPMPDQPEIHRLSAHLALWHKFDPKVKADLFSTLVTVPTGTFLIDPIAISDVLLQPFVSGRPVAGIIVTNANHWRLAGVLAEHLSASIFARQVDGIDPELPPFTPVAHGMRLGEALEVIALDGAVNGEIALYNAADGGTLVIGDALINFEPYGFTFLPPKYCLNSKVMRRSLRQLLQRPIKQIFFAHGMPILTEAATRLEQLLDGDS